MPTVSPNGKMVTFKMMPHYLEDIKCGRKEVDIRRLDPRWHAILCHAEKVKFESTEADDCVVYELRKIVPLSDKEVELVLKLYADVRWCDNYGIYYLLMYYLPMLYRGPQE